MRNRDLAAPRRPIVGVLLAVVVCAALAAYGAGAATTATAELGGCGTIPAAAAKDPQKLLARLPARLRAEYAGYRGRIFRSAWSRWQPKGSPPYTVGLAYGPLNNSFQAYTFNLLQKFLRRNTLVGDVIAVAAPSPTAITEQLQQYQALVQQQVDLIIVQPRSGAAFTQAVEAAARAGIPTISIFNNLDSPSSVDVLPNSFLMSAEPLSHLLRILGGKGELLGVHGTRTAEIDQDSFAAYRALLALCPDVTLVGEVDGFFAPPVTRTAVLQFLSTHPGSIDGVVQTADMSASIIGAFLQAGRPVPPVLDTFPKKGSLAYWRDNAGRGYRTAGTAGGPTSIARLVTRIAHRMLAGQGPKLSDLIWPYGLVTSTTLDRYVKPGWTFDTPGAVESPASTWRTDGDLDLLFTHPARKT